jgi:hypothetical protein
MNTSSKYARTLSVGLLLLAVTEGSFGQGLTVPGSTEFEVQILQENGTFNGCGLRIMAVAVTILPATRVWDVSIIVARNSKGAMTFIKGGSFVLVRPGAAPQIDKMPTTIAFSLRGEKNLIRATNLMPSPEIQGFVLGNLEGDSGADLLSTLLAGEKQVLLFFEAPGRSPEVITIKGAIKPQEHGALSQCLHGLLGD